MLTIPVTILSAVYMCLLTVAYFSKDRISSIENKIYSNMIKLSCLGIIIDATSCLMVIFNMTETVYFRTVTILMFMYYILWSGLFVTYSFTVSFQKKGMSVQEFENKYSRKIKYILLAFIICALLVPILPLSYYEDNNVIYPEGLSVNFTYFIAGFLSILIMLIILIKNRKSIKSKKYIPIYSLIILFLLAVAIQKLNPGLILTTTVECFITFIMYFTIENPDYKIIEELNRNKSIIEKTSQSTSNFMFKLTTDAKKYLNDIDTISENAGISKDYKSSIKDITEKTKEFQMVVNNLIDISAIDVKNIKITNEIYNISKIFEEIKLQNQSKMNDINFIINISPNLPDKLYGDKIRIKQVLSSLINNALKHTEKGFISLDVNTIIKYDACRLIISVEDSGSGLSLEKVNDILSFNENISDVELSQIDTLDMDLKMIKKVIKMLGGSLLLSSEEDKGTKVTIILDQKIAGSINTELEEKLTNYNNLLGIQKVLIVDDDLNELNEIEDYFSEFGIETVGTMYGADAIDKVRTGQSFDLILLDDEMIPTNAINVLEKLREYKVTSEVIVMLKEKKVSLSKHYLKDGFNDFIDKSKLDVEIKRVVKKYLK